MTGRPGAPPTHPSRSPKNGLVPEINFEFVERAVVGRGMSDMQAGRTENLSVVGTDGPERREIDGNRCRIRRILAYAAFLNRSGGEKTRKGLRFAIWLDGHSPCRDAIRSDDPGKF